jgi:2-methylcitrate dehydratase PrpD
MSASKPPLLANATADLASFAASLEIGDIPSDVIAHLKLCILDSVGVCLHGMTLPWTQMVKDMVLAEQAAGDAILVGTGATSSPANAALVNGTAGHAFELDDIHKESIVHPGSLAVPVALALLPLAQCANGEEFLTAIAAGYEVGTRVGNAATQALLLDGFHPQGTSGVFVAAATAARMLRLDARATQHCLGIAGSQTSGLMAAQEGAMVKRLHCGRAAQSGVYAALLAQRGFTGIEDVLEASYGGFLSTHSSAPAPHKLTSGLGHEWQIRHVGFKPYAAVTSIHTALDALRQIMREQQLQANDLAAIDASVSSATYVHCAWEYTAQGVTAAQMNLYFGLALIALDGNAFVQQYRQERLRDPRILDLISRTTAHIDAGIDARGAAFRHAARVRVRTHGGQHFEQQILHRRGSAEHALTQAEIITKFRDVVRDCISDEDASRIISAVDSLDSPGHLPMLEQCLAAPRSVPT